MNGSTTGGPWHRIVVSRGPAGPLTQQRILDTMGDLLRARALQASGWRESGRSVAEVRVQIYAHLESDVIVWHVNAGALELYHAAVGRRDAEARVDVLPSVHAPALLLDAVDYGLRSILLLGAILPGLW